MHPLLENYLAQVAAHLGPMPVKRRNEELREMRAHLENAIIVSRDLGQSEEEAVKNAGAQFGMPRDLGENVVWAWRRGVIQDKRSFLGATVTTTLLICLGTLLMNFGFDFLGFLFSSSFGAAFCARHPNFGMAFVEGTILASFGLAGLVAGALFPKRTLWGVCLGLAVFWVGWAAVDGVGQLRLLVTVEGLTHQERSGWILIAIASAWVASRWRIRRVKRSRLARN